jgi:hypothetical protein
MMRRFSALILVAVLICTLPLAAQSNGTLKAKVDPSHAGLFLDGKYLGPAAHLGMTRKCS